jgi:hypothetical protein
MIATLPDRLLEVFERSVTTEYVTVDRRGQPIVWPVTPYFRRDDQTIDVTTGLGYPKKADDAAANPHVALLFSDPTGSGLDDPPMVLVQGTATVDDRDLDANRDRYARESAAKLPATRRRQPPGALRPLFDWYVTRIYVRVRPERVYLWPEEDPEREPELLDAHLEEVRSGHNEEPEEGHAAPEGGGTVWHERLEELGRTHPTAAVAVVGPDGFPFAVRVAVRAERAAGLVHLEADPVGAPLEPGLACLTAHAHAPDFTWQRNLQVRGDLVRTGDGWALAPHRVVGGFELPPDAGLRHHAANARKAVGYARTARARRRRRGRGRGAG